MKAIIIKTIYGFDDEFDISYVKFSYDMASSKVKTQDDLIKAIEEVNAFCTEGICETDDCIYANEGHTINTLCSYLQEKYNVTSEIIVGFTVNYENCIVSEPHYDYEMCLW